MKPNWKIAAQTACMIAAIGISAALRSIADRLGTGRAGRPQPEMRADVQKRAVGGNSVTEVLQVMLLNNIKAKQPANQIIAMDWGKGAAVVQMAAGGMKVVHFDTKTLQIKD